MKHVLSLSFLCLMLFYGSKSYSQIYAEMGLGMHHLTNITNQEIGPTTPMMLRFAGIEKSASWFQWGANFGLLGGNATGLTSEDASEPVNIGLFSAELGGGCHITPLGHQTEFPFQPYLGVGGVLDMTIVLLQSGIAPNDPNSPHHLGYSLSVGAYIHITQTFGINLQVEQVRFITGAKGENHFLDGDRFLITFFKETKAPTSSTKTVTGERPTPSSTP